MNIEFNEKTKNKLVEYINKYPGIIKHENITSTEINQLEHDSILSTKLCITFIEYLLYDCENMKGTLNQNKIYNEKFSYAENLYTSFPKDTNYKEYSGIFYQHIQEYSNMSNEKLEFYLNTVFNVKDIYSEVIRDRSITNRANRILKSIDSLKSQRLELSSSEKDSFDQIYNSIKKFSIVIKLIINNCVLLLRRLMI